MKFVLNASIDTLPSKVNLRQWGKVTNDKCFCGQRQTLNHILSCCKKALEQGRYTYRHDNILAYISKCLDTDKFRFYVDIENHQTSSGGTIPTSALVTTLKPDIVIVYEKKNTMDIFELTVPGETRIEIAHKLKQDKYQHFSTDIKYHSVTVIPFEVGSHTGHISRENKSYLQRLHKYCKKEVKLKSFKNNISTIAVLGSYLIFNNRNTEAWGENETILAPFTNN
eukprot:GFUD01050852.1.p1 GENE.GFUD01050852.1~~GFUD01050852.1.p1  ORF type:complete len:225 (+),score=45.14 GFUD01050852.1:255-929(+)